MKTIQPSALLMFLLLLLCPLFAADQLYTIKMKRAFLPGSQYGINVTMKENFAMSAITVDRKEKIVNNTYSKHLNLEADVEISRVSSTGEPIQLVYTIRQFTDLNIEGNPPILPRGSSVTVKIENDDESFFINGQAVNDKLNEQLSAVISIDSEKDNTDLLFGTNKKMSIGEKWAVNTLNIVEGFSHKKLSIPENDIDGSCSISNLLKVGDQDCMKIICQMNIKNVNLYFPDTIGHGNRLG